MLGHANIVYQDPMGGVVDKTIFKAYDIRGIFPDQIDAKIAYLIGQGYAKYVQPKGEVAVGRDVRLHSEELQSAVIEGLVDAGVDVVDLGLISSDMLYFGVGTYGFSGGIQVTASHNPPEWHGMKFVREKVIPLTGETGIPQIYEFVAAGEKLVGRRGKIRKMELLDEYCGYLLKWLRKENLRAMKIVYNPNFGYAGIVFERLVEIGKLPFQLVGLNHRPDGHFPKGRPDPFVLENRIEFSELVKTTGADLGIAWDADADRVFFAAAGGIFMEPYHLNPLLIKDILKTYPKAKIIYDPRYTRALVDAILEGGGEPVLVKVGHSFIKEAMRKHDAVFAAESSGHTYYRDYWFADCGMLPPMQLISYLNESEIVLPEYAKEMVVKYPISGEISQKVEAPIKKITELAERYEDGKQSRLDGLTVEYDNFRFNVRMSNTEALLRLNLEGVNPEIVKTKTEEILAVIKAEV